MPPRTGHRERESVRQAGAGKLVCVRERERERRLFRFEEESIGNKESRKQLIVGLRERDRQRDENKKRERYSIHMRNLI